MSLTPMGKSGTKHRNSNSNRRRGSSKARAREPNSSAPAEAIKAAEEVALAAFGSGLKLAAAFSTVAAKTTSLALASLASGADKFSDLLKKEALASRRPVKRTKKKRIARQR